MGSRTKSNIYGWETEGDLATEIYCSSFRDLLEGKLVFAYKSSKTVKLLVVTKTEKGFRMCQECSGWSCYIPYCNFDYLSKIVLDDLQKDKTEKYIIEDYLDCINYYDKN